jgi:uncharacterized protein DUF6893
MTYIRIPVPVAIAVVLAAILAAVGAQLPEIQRYLKVRAM